MLRRLIRWLRGTNHEWTSPQSCRRVCRLCGERQDYHEGAGAGWETMYPLPVASCDGGR